MALRIAKDVRVIVESDDGFRDAIYLAPEALAALSDAEVAAMGKARYDAHLERLATPVKVVPPTDEQVAAHLDDLVRQKAAINAELDTVDPIKVDEAYVRTGVEKGDAVEILEPADVPIVKAR